MPWERTGMERKMVPHIKPETGKGICSLALRLNGFGEPLTTTHYNIEDLEHFATTRYILVHIKLEALVLDNYYYLFDWKYVISIDVATWAS
ncbi:hypothetical protein Tco_1345326 [Tanacetum coccineum]